MSSDSAINLQDAAFFSALTYALPGRPNYESVEHGDELELVYVLTAETPRDICAISPESGRKRRWSSRCERRRGRSVGFIGRGADERPRNSCVWDLVCRPSISTFLEPPCWALAGGDRVVLSGYRFADVHSVVL